MEEEQEMAKKMAEATGKTSDPPTPRSTDESAKGSSEDYGGAQAAKGAEGKKGEKEKKEGAGKGKMEVNKFSNGMADGVRSGSSKSPVMKAFVQLNTIEEERYETHTSNYGES